TVVVPRGGSGTVTVRLARSGLVGLNVRLSVPILPPGVFLTPPSFSPGVTQGDSSTLTLRVDNAAAPGDYPLIICTTIVGDPKTRCHSARTTLRVLAASACTSPQAWYPLNGDGMDASGNGNHGTVQGATPAGNRHGDPQAALAFDGSDDAVQLGDRFNTLTLPFSIAAWVYRSAAAGEGLRAIFVTDDEPGRYAGIWFQTDGPGQPSITFADGGGTGAAFRRTFTASSAIPSDTWVHLTATVRGPTDMTLYVNGAAVPGTYSGTGGPLVHTPAPARIGRITILPANQPWLGQLDELRIYNCSLDPSGVAALHALR
ncbi:MAG TPA: LamG domain-containing protein, partial [Longimicrobiales bacterium]|nr:LamG domain-containing protein [Longimicrobiales bacterium]